MTFNQLTSLGSAAKRVTALVGLVASSVSFSAHAGLVISASYDANSTFTAAEKASIDAAINVIESSFSDPYTIKIKFTNLATGLGGSSTWITSQAYSTVHTKMTSDATTASDTSALGTLGSTDSFFRSIILSTAQCRVLGMGCGQGGDGFDGTININTTLTDADRSDGIGAGKYDMMSVVLHEIDEVMGSGSWIGQSTNPAEGRVQDLFRYTAGGARTFTAAGDDAYLSIDGGVTDLARFNQLASGDYGDFYSCGPGATPAVLVQNACGSPGVLVDYSNVELTMMDVLGYDRIVSDTSIPEPSSALLLIPALAALRRMRLTKA
ncbi:MAG: NF038122 family metalloprotease [Ideonella sp.]|nr:NF038122 family metalloprotease [Ideonella sp.]